MKRNGFFQQWFIALVLILGMPLSNAQDYDGALQEILSDSVDDSVFTLGAEITQQRASISENTQVYSLSVNFDALQGASLVPVPFPRLKNYYLIPVSNRLSDSGRELMDFELAHFDGAELKSANKQSAQFNRRGNRLSGHFQVAGYVYQVIPSRSGGHELSVMAQAEYPNTEDAQPSEHPDPQGAVSSSSGAEPMALMSAGDTLVSNPVLDLLVVYERTATARTADPVALAEMAMEQTNDILQNSGINAQVRLAGTANVDFVRNNSFDDLDALTNLGDGQLDEVLMYRDLIGADLVVLMVGGSYDNCGRAWIDVTAEDAFSVVKDDCALGNYTFAHELAHNFGAHHNQEESYNYFYPYGHGLYNQSYGWRTVMSYQCPGGSCPRIPYFSNPLLQYEDMQLGTQTTHNNARVLNERAIELSVFRQSPAESCADYSATVSEHVNAGRVRTSYSFFGSRYYVVGSGEYVGRDASQQLTLLQLTNGFSLGSCASLTAPDIENVQWQVTGNELHVSGQVTNHSLPLATVSLQDSWQPEHPTLCRFDNTGSFQCVMSNIIPGSYQVILTAQDQAGYLQADYGPIEFVVGSGEPPSIESATVAVEGRQVNVQGNALDVDRDLQKVDMQLSSGSSYSCQLSAGQFSCAVYNLPSGAYQATLIAEDANGNRSQPYGPLNFNVDVGQPPEIISLNLQAGVDSLVMDGVVVDNDADIVSISAQLLGPTSDQQACTLNGSGIESTFQCQFTGLANGLYLFGVEVVDSQDNRAFYQGDNQVTIGNLGNPPIIVVTSTQVSGLLVDVMGYIDDADNDVAQMSGWVRETEEAVFCFVIGNNFQCQWEASAAGSYTLDLLAEDSLALSDEYSLNVELGHQCQVYTTSLDAHVAAGRVERIYRYFAYRYYAVGSEDYLGRDGSQLVDLAEINPGYYQADICP